MGKNAAFTVAEDNKFIPQPEKGISAEQSIFLASLVCNLRYNTVFFLHFFLSFIFTHELFFLYVNSFTGQTILTWNVPETSDTKISRSSCQQGSDSVSGLFSFPSGFFQCMSVILNCCSLSYEVLLLLLQVLRI